MNEANSENFSDSGKKFWWEFYDPGEEDFHVVTDATFDKGTTGSFIVSNWLNHVETGWMDNSWEIYYDGSDVMQPKNTEVVGSSFGEVPLSSTDDPVKQSQNPPENPEEWTYHPVPKDFEPEKIPKEKFPKGSELRKQADEYVIRTMTPLWTRKANRAEARESPK